MRKYILAIGMLMATDAFSETLIGGSPTLAVASDGGKISSGGFFYEACRNDAVNNFAPLPLSRPKTIMSINCLVTKKEEGPFLNDDLLLTFEIRDYQGNIRSVVSRTPIKLGIAEPLTVFAPELSKRVADRRIKVGEYLAIHVYRVGPAPSPEECSFLSGGMINLYCQSDVW